MDTRTLRLAVAALLIVGAALFAVGSIVEHGRGPERGLSESTTTTEGGESTGEHSEGTGTSHPEGGSDEVRPLGLNLEATPFVVVGILVSVGLAIAIVWKPYRPVLGVTVVFAAVFTLLDLLEVMGQAGHDAALVAIAAAVGLAHLAVVVLGSRLWRAATV